MYYLEGHQLQSDIVQEIELKKITETQPEQRLKKLIRKGHLEEAEVKYEIYIIVKNIKISYFRILQNNLI